MSVSHAFVERRLGQLPCVGAMVGATTAIGPIFTGYVDMAGVRYTRLEDRADAVRTFHVEGEIGLDECRTLWEHKFTPRRGRRARPK